MGYTSALYRGIEIDITANDLTKAGVDGAVNNLKKIDDQSILTTANLAKITAAFGAITAVGMTLASAADRVETLEIAGAQAAITADMTSEAFYNLADSVDNAADPIDEIVASMEYLTHNGVTTEAEIKSLYISFDKLADGAGSTSTQVERELIPMMRALGIPLQDVTKYTDALTIAVKTTNLTIGDLAFYTKRYGEQFTEMGAGIPEIIALFETLNQLGIEGRPMMTKLNEMFKAQGENASIAAKGEEELVKIQKELNAAQLEGSKTTKNYLEDMQMAGRDVGKMRALTIAYKRNQEEKSTKISGLQSEKSTIEDTIAKAKAAPKFSYDDAIAKLHEIDPRITKESVAANLAAQTAPGTKEKVQQYQEAGEMTTGGTRASFWTDEKMRELGANINPAQSEMIHQAANIAGIATTVSSILTVLKGLSGLGGGGGALAAGADVVGIAGGAAGLGAAGSGGGATVAGSVGLGALAIPVAALAATVVGTIVVGEEYDKVVRAESGRLKQVWLKEHPGATDADFERYKESIPEAGTTTVASSGESNYAGLDFDIGGVVPGPIGAPQKATVHGGETITPAGQSAGGLSISIGNVNLSKDYPFQQMMKDIESYQKTKGQQRGMRTAV